MYKHELNGNKSACRPETISQQDPSVNANPEKERIRQLLVIVCFRLDRRPAILVLVLLHNAGFDRHPATISTRLDGGADATGPAGTKTEHITVSLLGSLANSGATRAALSRC